MTLQELYQSIGGNYENAIRVLRMEKLMDKHIRKFTKNGVAEKLLEAGRSRDAKELFESAHALKGVCGNLGLTKMSELASEIAEEFRPGNARKLSDEEVDGKIAKIGEMYRKVCEGISRYEEG